MSLKDIPFYGASKTKHAAMWRAFRGQGYSVTGRWIDEPVDKSQRTLCHTTLWKNIEEDIRASKLVILYAEPGEILKGALVEFGMACALRLPIYVWGHRENETISTFMGHPCAIEHNGEFDIDECLWHWQETASE